jgi:hypothetical protein
MFRDSNLGQFLYIELAIYQILKLIDGSWGPVDDLYDMEYRSAIILFRPFAKVIFSSVILTCWPTRNVG